MIMANHNSFIHNTGLTEDNSLVHLLATLSPLEDNEADVIEHSKYYDNVDFNNALQSYNSKISMLSLNCQSISAKYDKFKLFLDDVNNQNPISIICIQETWGHEDIHMDYFSLHNYTLVNANRCLTTHAGLSYIFTMSSSLKSSMGNYLLHIHLICLKVYLLKFGGKTVSIKRISLEIFTVYRYIAPMIYPTFTNEYVDILNVSKSLKICLLVWQLQH